MHPPYPWCAKTRVSKLRSRLAKILNEPLWKEPVLAGAGAG